MYAVITAGGKGTRIREIAGELPKPMISVLGRPILEYAIDSLKRQGIYDIVITIGFLGCAIKDYFSDGKNFGVRISYVEEQEPLGTGGALYFLKGMIKEDFLLVNGDILFDVDMARFIHYHRSKGGKATLFTHPNSHPFDSGIIVKDQNGRVISWLHREEKRTWYKNQVNGGIHMLSPDIFRDWNQVKKRDLDRDILKPLIREGLLYAYQSPEYVKDMGTPKRYFEVEQDLKSGLVASKSLSHKQKAVFLDRDGTINRYCGFLTRLEQFELIEGAAEGIKSLNERGFLVIVVTNQPVIARGELKEQELEAIHNKMETLLGREGAYLDAIYYCPHHPDKGYDGERSELKLLCSCRKPRTGLIDKAAEDFPISLEDSWMIGDSIRDVEAGKAAGLRTILLADREHVEKQAENTVICRGLKEAAGYVLANTK